MKELVTVVRDDLDHTLLADKTIQFSWDGVDFEIDLTGEHLDQFADVMTPWIVAARKVKRQKRRKSAAPVNEVRVPEPAKPDEAGRKALRGKVREHARANGIEQANTGQLKQASIDLWLRENPGDAAALGVTE